MGERLQGESQVILWQLEKWIIILKRHTLRQPFSWHGIFTTIYYCLVICWMLQMLMMFCGFYIASYFIHQISLLSKKWSNLIPDIWAELSLFFMSPTAFSALRKWETYLMKRWWYLAALAASAAFLAWKPHPALTAAIRIIKPHLKEGRLGVVHWHK